jgi:hypothetical protein
LSGLDSVAELSRNAPSTFRKDSDVIEILIVERVCGDGLEENQVADHAEQTGST